MLLVVDRAGQDDIIKTVARTIRNGRKVMTRVEEKLSVEELRVGDKVCLQYNGKRRMGVVVKAGEGPAGPYVTVQSVLSNEPTTFRSFSYDKIEVLKRVKNPDSPRWAELDE